MPLVSDPCPRLSLYVHPSFRHLTRVFDDLLEPPLPIIVERPQLRHDTHGVSNPLRLISWYTNSMGSNVLILHPAFEALRQNRADDDENYHHPKPSLETLLRVKHAALLAVPYLMSANHFQSNLGVPKPLILKNFPNFMDEVSLDHRSDAKARYDCTLHI